ncbi:MAG: Kelch repeat-containing protein, partial [Bacteroidota bacterium]
MNVSAQCTWAAAAVYPVNVLDQGVTSVGGNLYSFAGVSNGAIVATSFRFDGTAWFPIAATPQALEFPSAATDGTNIFVMGGAATTGTPQTVNYRYNVATNTYTTMAPFSTGTWNHAAVYLSGKIYKFGGTGPATASTAVLEIYDIASNTWSAGAPMPDPTSFPGAFAIGNFIYAVGGINTTGTVASLKTYRYDPVANSWSDANITDLPATRWGPASGPYFGGGLVAGGYVGGSVTANISTTALLWDPVTDNWTTVTVPNMTGERARVSGYALGSSFYVVGGRSIASAGFNGTNTNQRLTCVVPPPCTGTPAPGNTVSTANPVCPSQSFTLSPQNVTPGSGVTYQWQTSASASGPWSNVAAPPGIGPTLTTTTSVSQYYRVIVTCGANSGTSTPLLINSNPFLNCYCNSVAGSAADEDIFNVTFGTINNSSTCATIAPGPGSIQNRYS